MASSQSSWNTVFHRLFGGLRHEWNISEANDDGLPDIRSVASKAWKQFQDKGKVHFECGDCRKSWSSLNGAIIFHYRLTETVGREKQGEVKFWYLGQKCKTCRGEFEEPIWYEQEIERALQNMLLKVEEKFYGRPREDVNVRQLGGNMSSGHQQELCHACERGVCGRRDEESDLSRAFADLGLQDEERRTTQ